MNFLRLADMPVKNIISIIVFFSICMHSQAGTNDSSKRIYVSEGFISGGAYGQTNPEGTLKNFRGLAPGSTLLLQNYAGYHEYSSGSNGQGNPMIILGIGLRSKCKTNSATYRFAVGYGLLTDMEGQYYTTNKFRIDTLTSSRTGQNVYIDSTVDERYTFAHYSRILKLDVSVIWRTSAKQKTKLFAGIGCFAGTSLYSETRIEYSKINRVNYPSNNYYFGPGLTNQKISETYHQKSQTMAAIYCPFGIDYQLSKKSDFFKNLNLFLELRTQLYYKKIPELGKTIQGGLQVNIGLRYTFSRKNS